MAIRKPLPPSDSYPSPYHGQRMSRAAYLKLLDVKPSLEYLDGLVVQKPVGKRKHWILTAEVAVALTLYGRAHGGRSGVEAHIYFDPPRRTFYRVPDLAYWAPGKAQGDDDMSLPPTLAVEIRSPDETIAAQREKCRFYRQNGVDACWLIDPETRTIERFEDAADGELVPAGGTLTSRHLPGFELALVSLWSALD